MNKVNIPITITTGNVSTTLIYIKPVKLTVKSEVSNLTDPLLNRDPLNRLGDYPYDRVQHQSSQ